MIWRAAVAEQDSKTTAGIEGPSRSNLADGPAGGRITARTTVIAGRPHEPVFPARRTAPTEAAPDCRRPASSGLDRCWADRAGNPREAPAAQQLRDRAAVENLFENLLSTC